MTEPKKTTIDFDETINSTTTSGSLCLAGHTWTATLGGSAPTDCLVVRLPAPGQERKHLILAVPDTPGLREIMKSWILSVYGAVSGLGSEYKQDIVLSLGESLRLIAVGCWPLSEPLPAQPGTEALAATMKLPALPPNQLPLRIMEIPFGLELIKVPSGQVFWSKM